MPAEGPSDLVPRLLRGAGSAGLLVLWLKAMSISAFIWTAGFCFLVMGAALPWRPLPLINVALVVVASMIFAGAYKLDCHIWRSYKEARQALRNKAARQASDREPPPHPD